MFDVCWQRGENILLLVRALIAINPCLRATFPTTSLPYALMADDPPSPFITALKLAAVAAPSTKPKDERDENDKWLIMESMLKLGYTNPY